MERDEKERWEKEIVEERDCDNCPQVFQYCKVDPTCVQGTEQYHKAKCDVRFLDLAGKSQLGCSKSPTPSVNESS